MENGKIIEDGKPKELKSNPKSTFTSMLNASDLSHQASQQKWRNGKAEMAQEKKGRWKHITSLFN